MNKNIITIVYYKCPRCECRVGVPEDEKHKHREFFGKPEFHMFYCNGCEKEMPHIYCGYKNVQKE